MTTWADDDSGSPVVEADGDDEGVQNCQGYRVYDAFGRRIRNAWFCHRGVGLVIRVKMAPGEKGVIVLKAKTTDHPAPLRLKRKRRNVT